MGPPWARTVTSDSTISFPIESRKSNCCLVREEVIRAMAGKSDEFSKVDGSELNEVHLLPVVKALYETGVAQRAANIGLVLNVKNHYREAYKGEDKCVYNIMGAWLRKDLIEKKSTNHVSWRELCKAVKSQTGGKNPVAAKKIAENYKRYMTFEEQKFATADTTTLDGDDTKAVSEALEVVSARWYQIGVALGLSTNTLNECSDLEAMVKEWLKNETNQGWKALLVAIDAHYGGQNPRYAQVLLSQQGRKRSVWTSQKAIVNILNRLGEIKLDGPVSEEEEGEKEGEEGDEEGIIDGDGMWDWFKKNPKRSPFAPYERKKGGVALVIVNEKFTHLKDRGCAYLDHERITKMLGKFNYRVHDKIKRCDCTAREIEEAFKAIREEVRDDDDSFVCVISSHGSWDPQLKTDVVCGTDGRCIENEKKEVIAIEGAVNIKELAHKYLSPITAVDGEGCAKLKGKPKLFFIQACRGDDSGLVTSDNTNPPEPTDLKTTGLKVPHIPKEADFCFSYSTAPGTESFRLTPKYPDLEVTIKTEDGEKRYYGSLYISLLWKYTCECSYADHLPITPILERISHELDTELEYCHTVKQREGTATKKSVRQCPQFLSSLRGPVFLTAKAQKKYIAGLPKKMKN